MKAEQGEIVLDDCRIAFTVTRSRRRRRTMAFRMEGAGALKIMAPMRASVGSIRSMIEKHTVWIMRRVAEFQKAAVMQPVRLPQGYDDGASFHYLGHACTLKIAHDQNAPQGCRLLPHRLMVNIPLPQAGGGRGGRSHDVTNAISPPSVPPVNGREELTASLQEEVRLEILLWLKKRAKAKFQRRMDFWAQHLGVRYRRLSITNAGRRWGSCSVKNDIRLNWRLIMAPLPILDYVVVHELCHVRHKNHGPHFWAQVASVMADYKARRRALKCVSNVDC